MNAIRKFRVLALVALLAVAVLGVGAATAEAGGGCHYGGYGGYKCYYPSYNYCSYPTYNYCNYGYGYDYSCYYPKTCNYPVTSFDCYGRPSTFWQTGYGSVPVSYLP